MRNSGTFARAFEGDASNIEQFPTYNIFVR